MVWTVNSIAHLPRYYTWPNCKDRGARFPADFTNKGNIIVTRKPRGRSARVTNGGIVRYAEWQKTDVVSILLWGDEGELAYPESKSRDIKTLLQRSYRNTQYDEWTAMESDYKLDEYDLNYPSAVISIH